MPKTATDRFFGTGMEPLLSGRHAQTVAPSDTADLPAITSQLWVFTGTGSGLAINVIFADDLDNGAVSLPLQASTFYQFQGQIRRVMNTGTNLGTGGSAVAMWG